MRRKQRELIAQTLERDMPVWLLDEGRIVTRANLLLLWAYGALRIGEACDPGQIVGRHVYEILARNIAERRVSLEDPDNRHFILGRLRAVLGKPDANLPAVRGFLQEVCSTPAARRKWKTAVAEAYNGHGDPFALQDEEIHYPVIVRHPDGTRLHLVVTVDRLEDGGRLIRYEPWEFDEPTQEAVASAYDRIRTLYPHVSYVQDVRHLTAFSPVKDQNATRVRPTMPSNPEQLVASEGVPDSRAGNPTSGSAAGATEWAGIAAAEWRPTEPFPREEIEHAFGTQAESLGEHPVYGRGFGWQLPGGVGEPTRLEVFPERRWASVRYIDGSLKRQERGLIIDYLAVREVEERPALSLVSVREGRGTLINVYPSGEVDEFFRLQPATAALPPEAVIFAAQTTTLPVAPAPREEPALTAVEVARELGTGAENVRALLRAGRLPGFKRGGAWYVPARAVAEFQASRRH
jgi:hypothetical protein